jgi:lysozyme
MMLSPAAEELIKDHEGLRLQAYLCPAGRWTIGWGHTAGVTKGMVITMEQAEQFFREDVEIAAAGVRRLLRYPANDNQMSAMISLVFNIGETQFAKSTVLRAHNRGDTAAAARAFNLWIKITDPATGKKLDSNGLIARRAKEAALYLTAVSNEFKTPTPQTVSAPTPPSRSPTAIGSVVTTATGGVAVASQAVSVISEITYQTKTFWEIVRDLSPVVLGIIAVVAVGFVLYRWFKRSEEGWL